LGFRLAGDERAQPFKIHRNRWRDLTPDRLDRKAGEQKMVKAEAGMLGCRQNASHLCYPDFYL
jgi:hypothetical protein